MRRVSRLALAALLSTACLPLGAAVHIDPTAPADGADGSLAHPFRSWDGVTLVEGETYLQRRGTTTVTGPLKLAPGVTLGAYGKGDRPVIRSTAGAKEHAVSGWRTHGARVRDLAIEAPDATSCINWSGADDVIVRDCELSGAGWGLRTTAASRGVKVLDTVIHTIGDDGLFAQDAVDIEIAGCHAYRVNSHWREPYTSQKEAAGDGIQLSECENWWVHHNTLDRTSSGNKFCFISNGPQTRGVFEHNRLTGPLTTGDGGASIYFGQGGRGVVVRYNLIEAPSPGGIYHHTAGLEVYGNVFVGVPVGVTSYGPEPATRVHDNLFVAVPEPVKGSHVEMGENVVVALPDGAELRRMRLVLDEPPTDGFHLDSTAVAGAERYRVVAQVSTAGARVQGGRVVLTPEGGEPIVLDLLPGGVAQPGLWAAAVEGGGLLLFDGRRVELTAWRW